MTDNNSAPEWHRSDNASSILLYTLKDELIRRGGKRISVNDLTIRIENANGSQHDLGPLADCILAALQPPEAKPFKMCVSNDTLKSMIEADPDDADCDAGHFPTPPTDNAALVEAALVRAVPAHGATLDQMRAALWDTPAGRTLNNSGDIGLYWLNQGDVNAVQVRAALGERE